MNVYSFNVFQKFRKAFNCKIFFLILIKVWPEGKVIFPDFFKNATERVWEELIRSHHSNISFDGLWIDMNEPANFGTNEEKPWNWPQGAKPYWSLKCNEGEALEDPPYRTMAAFVYDREDRKIRISDKTICMVAKQGNNGEYNHYDVHSLYGWSQSPSTLNGLRQATNKRGIMISRSTFPGSGKYAGHWLGDNSAVWPDIHLSIIGSLEFNLFGIPYIGADICGFFGNSSAQLCKRWMQLGAFYTFSRNHNGINYEPQDPAYFGEDVAEASRIALETRYSLLPYLYTLFFRSHSIGGFVENGKFYLSSFKFNGTYFSMTITTHNETMVDSIRVGSMTIFGIKREITSVTVNNASKSFEKLKPHNKLYIKDLGVTLQNNIEVVLK